MEIFDKLELYKKSVDKVNKYDTKLAEAKYNLRQESLHLHITLAEFIPHLADLLNLKLLSEVESKKFEITQCGKERYVIYLCRNTIKTREPITLNTGILQEESDIKTILYNPNDNNIEFQDSDKIYGHILLGDLLEFNRIKTKSAV